MKPGDFDHEDAIRRLASRAVLDKPSSGFTARIMDRLMAQPEPLSKRVIIYQYVIMALAASVAVLMLIFPAWTVFDFDVKTLGASATQVAGNLLRDGLLWMADIFSRIPNMGKYAYFIPVSVALLIIVSFDQVISRKPETQSARHGIK